MLLDYEKIFDGLDAAVSHTSTAQQTFNSDRFSISGFTTTDGAGVLKAQVSNAPNPINDAANVPSASFIDLTNATSTITSAGSGFFGVASASARWMRLVWTPAATSGNATIAVAHTDHGLAAATTPQVTISNDSEATITGVQTATVTSADEFTFIITDPGLSPGTLNWVVALGGNGKTYAKADNGDGTFTITVTSVAHGYLIGSTPTITVASATDADCDGTQTATITTANAFTFVVTAAAITLGTLNWSGLLSGTTDAYTVTPIDVAGTITAHYNSKGM